MMKINEILNKYNITEDMDFFPNVDSLYDDRVGVRDFDEQMNLREKQLFDNWKQYIGNGWYGFALGIPTPLVWYDVIDEFLEYIKENDKEFKILQIKVKWGGLRFYVDLTKDFDSIEDQIRILENNLYSKKLIF